MSSCPPNHYIDDLTTVDLNMCVPSCLNLEPSAYIFEDSTSDNKKKCIHNCPEELKYVDMSNKDHPECVSQCPDN